MTHGNVRRFGFCTDGGNAGSAGQDASASAECSEDDGNAGGGGAGTDTAGGTGGTADTDSSGTASPGAAGTAGAGGAGGAGTTSYPSSGGGGAGGGYYGGGGGGGSAEEDIGAGGGGGSSFTAAHASDVSAATPTTASASVTITYSAQPKPKAVTHKATKVKSASATLHGSVNPEGLKTTYYFEYGTTKSFGKTTAKHSLKAGTSAKGVSAAIKGLKPNTTYHFRVVAKNASGTADGKDLTFKTAKATAVAPVFTG